MAGEGSSRAREVALAAVVLLCCALFFRVALRDQPLSSWLLVRYLPVWASLAAFCAATVSSGHLVTRRLLPADTGLHAKLTFAFAAGVVVFASLVFAAGVARAYYAPLHLALPLLAMLPGARHTYRELLLPLRDELRRVERPSAGQVVAIAAGCLGFVLACAPSLVPERAGLDARWYHLGIAENYVAAHRLVSFEGGWIAGALPHLASYLYTWAMLMPAGLFERTSLCLQLEVLLFASSVASVPLLVAHIAPGRHARWAWIAMFAFPALYVHETDLFGGADHIAGLFAVPIALATARAADRFDAKDCALLAIYTAGAALTKYTAAMLLLLPAVTLARRAIWRPPAGTLRGLAILALSFALLTAPHWLKNAIFYRDPLYPLLSSRLSPESWTADVAATWARFGTEWWVPGKPRPTGVLELLKLLATFSVEHHDWPGFHGNTPVFGSLFTLATLCLPLARDAKRLWWLIGGIYLGMVSWALAAPQDRYLVSMLPWMAAASFATLAKLWVLGPIARASIAAAVLLQAVWAFDLAFVPSHGLLHTSPIRALIDLLSTAHGAKASERLSVFKPFPVLGSALPKNALVLAHQEVVHLGLGVRSINDQHPYTLGIDHGRSGSYADEHRLLTGLGVTHLLYRKNSRAQLSLAADLVFRGYAETYGRTVASQGEHTVAEISASSSPDPRPLLVAALTCGQGPIPPGLYELGALDGVRPQLTEGRPKGPAKVALEQGDARLRRAILSDAALMVVEPRCETLSQLEEAPFVLLGQRGLLKLYARRRR